MCIRDSRTDDTEAFSFAFEPLVPILGDANCDRELTLSDGFLIVRFAVGIGTGTDTCAPFGPEMVHVDVADYDRNGRIDLGDALLVARCAIGICE